MLFDTHCHLDAAAFDADREQVISRARAAGVQGIIIPAVEVANFEQKMVDFEGLVYSLKLLNEQTLNTIINLIIKTKRITKP